MASNINPSFPIPVSPTTDSVRQNFAIAANEITDLQERLNGGGPGGPVQFSAILGDPTDNVNLNAALNARQPLLSFTGSGGSTTANSLRSINGQSLRGTDNIQIEGGAGGPVQFSAILGQPTDNTNLAVALNAKQNTLVWTGGSNTIRTVGGQTLQGPGNIQFVTVNGQSLLGSGNIVIEGGGPVGTEIGLDGTATLGRTGPPLLQMRNTTQALPPTNTQIGFVRVQGLSNTSPEQYGLGFEIQVRSSSTMAWSASSRGTEVQFITGRNETANPAIAFSIGHTGGLFMGGTSDSGPGTINAQAYFVNGTTLRQWILNTFQVEEW